MTPELRIKICCIASIEEMQIALDEGATALGFVSKMPSGPGPIDEDLIASIILRVPDGVDTFLLTSETTSDAIIAQQRGTRANTLQLVDAVEPGTYRAIRDALPDVKIVQVIHVTDGDSVNEALDSAREVDFLLLDSGNPRLAVKELGGTGRVHDWKLSRQIRDGAGVPVYLAGGLNSSNAGDAVRSVQPFGLDVCSGVRTDGRLDVVKLRDFISSARSALT